MVLLPGIRANLERYPSYTPSAVSILLGSSGESGRQSRIHPPFFNHSLVNPKVIYMKNFWQNLTKPIFALAPMQDVTDCAFREIFAKYGRSSPLLNPPPQGEEIKIVPLPRGEGLGEGVCFLTPPPPHLLAIRGGGKQRKPTPPFCHSGS